MLPMSLGLKYMKICFCQGKVLGFEHNVISFSKLYLGFNRISVCPIVLGFLIK